MTTTNGVLLSRLMSDGSDGFDLSPTDTEEVHVLAVDLIITDYCMPGMTGCELIKKIKLQSFTFREIPTVIISSENILKAHPGSIKPARVQHWLSRPQRGHLSVGEHSVATESSSVTLLIQTGILSERS
ncbi:hypothetical protein KPL70_013797 [Citrus sinensis]|nr:hypothetical protein KPL70_013797 [Citrus sinensis]